MKGLEVLNKAQDYINKFGVEQSAESLFAEFELKLRLHKEFETYIRQKGINEKLEAMQRCKRKLAKRKLFAEWYLNKTQNDLSIKTALINLSEMTFASERTLQIDLSSEATD